MTSLTGRNADLRKPYFPLPAPTLPSPTPPDDSPILLMGRLAPPLLSPWVFPQQRTKVSFEKQPSKGSGGHSKPVLMMPVGPPALPSPECSVLTSWAPLLTLSVPAALTSLLFPSGALCLKPLPPWPRSESTRPFLAPTS